MTDESLPAEHLSPLAELIDEMLAQVGYGMSPAITAIDDTVPGYGSLFDPGTTRGKLRGAVEDLLGSGVTRPAVPAITDDAFVLYRSFVSVELY